jgi:hypothetical protein
MSTSSTCHECSLFNVMSICQYTPWKPLSICHNYLSVCRVYLTYIFNCNWVYTRKYMSWLALSMLWVLLIKCHSYTSIRHEYVSVYIMGRPPYQDILWISLVNRWPPTIRVRHPRTDVWTLWGTVTLTVPVQRFGLWLRPWPLQAT